MGFCDSSQSQSNKGQYIDPLGPSSIGPHGKATYDATGAPQIRDQLFNYLGQYQPGMNQAGENYASGLQSAASNPGWNQASNLAQSTMAGNYLAGSPQLNAAMQANARTQMASAADTDARIKSQMQMNGMGYSTANQEAAQANNAAAAANVANTNAATYLNNYQAERANQNNSVNNLATATGQPLSYLSGVSGAYTQPLDQAGNLISSLASGGQVFNAGTSGSYSPSAGSSILQGIGAL